MSKGRTKAKVIRKPGEGTELHQAGSTNVAKYIRSYDQAWRRLLEGDLASAL